MTHTYMRKLLVTHSIEMQEAGAKIETLYLTTVLSIHPSIHLSMHACMSTPQQRGNTLVAKEHHVSFRRRRNAIKVCESYRCGHHANNDRTNKILGSIPPASCKNVSRFQLCVQGWLAGFFFCVFLIQKGPAPDQTRPETNTKRSPLVCHLNFSSPDSLTRVSRLLRIPTIYVCVCVVRTTPFLILW